MRTLNKIRTKIKTLESGLLQGKTPLSYLELGLLYQLVKDYDKAEEAFKKAIATLPDNIYPRFLLLRLYEAKGERMKVNALAKELMQANDAKMSIALKTELQKTAFWDADKTKDIAC